MTSKTKLDFMLVSGLALITGALGYYLLPRTVSFMIGSDRKMVNSPQVIETDFCSETLSRGDQFADIFHRNCVVKQYFWEGSDALSANEVVIPWYMLRVILTAPKRMAISETRGVELDIGISPNVRGRWQSQDRRGRSPLLRYEALLQSPSFSFTPAGNIAREGADRVSWSWLVKPKAAGRHLLEITFIEPGDLKLALRKLDDRAGNVTVSGDSMIIYIVVTTNLGLTAFQDSAVKAIGAVVGVLGVLLGYPFLRGRFQNRMERE